VLAQPALALDRRGRGIARSSCGRRRGRLGGRTIPHELRILLSYPFELAALVGDLGALALEGLLAGVQVGEVGLALAVDILEALLATLGGRSLSIVGRATVRRREQVVSFGELVEAVGGLWVIGVLCGVGD
jgi:hypothetical protein